VCSSDLGAESDWIFRYRDEMDKDLIDLILQNQLRLGEIRKEMAIISLDEERLNELATERDRINKWLAEARSNAVYFLTADVYDAIHVLGIKYVDEMYKTLSPADFNRSMLSIHDRSAEVKFYATFGKHNIYQSADNEEFLDNLSLSNVGTLVRDCRWDANHDSSEPLYIALDYNAKTSNMVVGQLIGNYLKIINTFNVKKPESLTTLLYKFHNYYKYSKNKHLHYVYDHTATGGNAKDPNYGFKDTVFNTLNDYGYDVYDCYVGQTSEHEQRFNLLADLFEDKKPIKVRIASSCENLIKAIDMTPGETSHRIAGGTRKDKSNEHSTTIDPALMTHVTDAMDMMLEFVIRSSQQDRMASAYY